jgi:hypothetical protein
VEVGDHTDGGPGDRLVDPVYAPYDVADDALVLDVADVRRGTSPRPRRRHDRRVRPDRRADRRGTRRRARGRAVLVTQDNIAGNELSRTGDLAPANTRLAQAGVTVERRTLLRAVRAGEVELEDRYSGERRTVACARRSSTAASDCPTEPIDGAVPDRRRGGAPHRSTRPCSRPRRA